MDDVAQILLEWTVEHREKCPDYHAEVQPGGRKIPVNMLAMALDIPRIGMSHHD